MNKSKWNHWNAEQAHEVVDLDEFDDTSATPVAGDPKVPSLVEGERDAQDEADHEDGGKSCVIPP